MADAPSNAPAIAMLWEEARRLLVRQEAALDTLRTQAIAVLSVGAIVAGLFGSHVVSTHVSAGAACATGAALALFTVSAVLAIYVLAPHDWTFAHGLGVQLRRVGDQEMVEAEDLAFGWATEFEKWRTDNQRQLDHLMRCFLWACALTGAQVIAWGLAVLL